MSRELKPGQRVRVTVRNRMAGYQPGDKGTVMREVADGPSGTRYYVVAMDKDDPIKRAWSSPTMRSRPTCDRGVRSRGMDEWHGAGAAVSIPTRG